MTSLPPPRFGCTLQIILTFCLLAALFAPEARDHRNHAYIVIYQNEPPFVKENISTNEDCLFELKRCAGLLIFNREIYAVSWYHTSFG